MIMSADWRIDRLDVEAQLIQRQLSDSNNPQSLDRLRESMAASHILPTEGVVEKTLLKLLVECPQARVRIKEKINSRSGFARSPNVKKWFQHMRRTASGPN